MSARDRPDCTVDMKDALERAMEILRSSELYAPIGRTDMGIVAGLLQVGCEGGGRDGRLEACEGCEEGGGRGRGKGW